MGQSEATAASMLHKFKAYIEDQLALMHKAIDDDAWAPRKGTADRSQKTVRALAHSVKGAASMVSAPRLTAISKRLQEACDPLDADGPSDKERQDARLATEVWKHEAATLLQVFRSVEMDVVVRSEPLWVIKS